MSTSERFWEKVDQGGPDECWAWRGALTSSGHGNFSVRGRMVHAHCVAYELTFGPIPDGLQIDHVRARGCVHRHCVNPAHLEAVTSRENTMRGHGPTARNAAKTHCPAGHEYDEANTRWYRGYRYCRHCQRLHSRARRRRQDP